MKIKIDTIKKELTIEAPVSVAELIEFLQDYKDYNIVDKVIIQNNLLNNPFKYI